MWFGLFVSGNVVYNFATQVYLATCLNRQEGVNVVFSAVGNVCGYIDIKRLFRMALKSSLSVLTFLDEKSALSFYEYLQRCKLIFFLTIMYKDWRNRKIKR